MGPLWAHTCYPFEDLNGKFPQLINGTWHINSQIVRSHIQHIKMVRKLHSIPEAWRTLNNESRGSSAKVAEVDGAVEVGEVVEEYFPENTHLLGDKAYTLQKHLMTPFIDNGDLTVEETHYNYVHSSTRMTIERAMGLLRLHYFENVDEILLPDEVDDVGALDATNESIAAGVAKRENLVTILNRDVEP
ncbi:hypothetical protein PV328_001284 [Microctonus aethiopoides]|uniref:DDE Tnp4 domain-containing protein n=1 Tax=Microctonus aethiopoides TaxID=144406 RepID=A0AA39FWZ1_9HYME|nr:hypothetical protein PV328_001284 [Microctonus aethiopoides]